MTKETKQMWKEKTETFNKFERENGYTGKNHSIRKVKKLTARSEKLVRQVKVTFSKEAYLTAMEDDNYLLILISELRIKRASKKWQNS